MVDAKMALAVGHDLESWQKLDGDLAGIAVRAEHKLVDKVLNALRLLE